MKIYNNYNVLLQIIIWVKIIYPVREPDHPLQKCVIMIKITKQYKGVSSRKSGQKRRIPGLIFPVDPIPASL